MYRLFIVEDDDGIAGGIASQASMWGIETVCASDFQNIISEFTAASPHIVLLDISLPFHVVSLLCLGSPFFRLESHGST